MTDLAPEVQAELDAIVFDLGPEGPGWLKRAEAGPITLELERPSSSDQISLADLNSALVHVWKEAGELTTQNRSMWLNLEGTLLFWQIGDDITATFTIPE